MSARASLRSTPPSLSMAPAVVSALEARLRADLKATDRACATSTLTTQACRACSMAIGRVASTQSPGRTCGSPSPSTPSKGARGTRRCSEPRRASTSVTVPASRSAIVAQRSSPSARPTVRSSCSANATTEIAYGMTWMRTSWEQRGTSRPPARTRPDADFGDSGRQGAVDQLLAFGVEPSRGVHGGSPWPGPRAEQQVGWASAAMWRVGTIAPRRRSHSSSSSPTGLSAYSGRS